MKKVGRLYRESLIQRIKEGVENNDKVFLLSCSNLSGFQISELRKSLRCTGAEMYMARNTIARRAFTDLSLEDFVGKILNQTAVVWGGSDSAEISKILVKFVEGAENCAVQGGIIDGKSLDGREIKKLSTLPSREVLLAMLLAAIQSPLTRFAGALNAKTRELLFILKQLSEKKGGN